MTSNAINEKWKSLEESNSFVHEIFQQPEAILDLVKFYTGDEGRGLLEDALVSFSITGYSQIIITGMGSSLFAGKILEILLSSCWFPVTRMDAGELLYYGFSDVNGEKRYPKEDNGKILLILVSQSGESSEIVKILNEIKSRKEGIIDTWGITNSLDSTLSKEVDTCFPLHAGPERSVTSKTYSNCLILMYMLGLTLVNHSKMDLDAILHVIQEQVLELERSIDELLHHQLSLAGKMVKFVGKDVDYIAFVARGASIATIEQAALNIKETAKIPSGSLTGGQFRHGPIEMINKDTRVIACTSDGITRKILEKMAWDIAHTWGGGKVIFITNRYCEKLDGEPRILQVKHDIENPFLATVMEILIIQLFMVELALERDLEPGVFKYSSKITKEG
ncbi:SIS domain-containing protein [Candidatus Bathyarchaeota archaeon]|nr:SIS domain-containing protein [Candidatus Bathyarchaeota archaeon]